MRRTRTTLLLTTLACACVFDETGAGNPGVATLADEPGSADGEMHGVDEPLGTEGAGEEDSAADDRATTTADGDESSVPGETGATEEGGGETSAADSAADSAAEESGGVGESGGAEPMCPIDVLELHWAEDSLLEAPMELAVASAAAGSPMVAVSSQSESGAVTFELDIPCAGEYAIFGLVWDYYPGAWGEPDPDSFYVGTGKSELLWRYGCQTTGEAMALSWQSLEQLSAQPCGTAPVVLDVAQPGPVTLRFRNREAGTGSEVAGIAAIVVASDPLADPLTLYSPY